MLSRLIAAVSAAVALVALTPLTAQAAESEAAPSGPSIEAHLESSGSTGDWHRGPVTVSYTCASDTALAKACPAPVTVTREGRWNVIRSIRTVDGRTASVTTRVWIDQSAPTVTITGVEDGDTYDDDPAAACSARDELSGVVSCETTVERRGLVVDLTARATDAAGNTGVAEVSYRLAEYSIEGASKKGEFYQLRTRKIYPIVVHGSRPEYVWATAVGVAPRRRAPVPFNAAGDERWTMGFVLSQTRYRWWKIAYRQGGELHVFKVRIIR